MDELNKMEIQEVEDMDKEERKGFEIGNIELCNWAFRKIKAYENEIKQIDELADREIKRIEDWRKKESQKAEGQINFFEGAITEYFIKMRKKNPEYKVNTPYGQVSIRKQQPKWHYDDTKILNWLRKNKPEMIEIQEKFNKNDIKQSFKVVGDKVVDKNGEIVEGVKIEERADKINIKVVD